MNAAATRIVDSLPSRGRVFLDGLRGMRKTRPSGTPTLSGEMLVRPAVTLDEQAIKVYARVCGFRPEQGVPLTFPHILAFPLHMLLLTAPRFPYSAVGMVHLANRISQHRRLEIGQAMRIEAHCDRWLAHAKGQAVVIVASARSGGELVWESQSIYLSRGVKTPSGDSYEDDIELDPKRMVMIQRWRLGGDLGRRYARISGDHNPIHASLLGAKLFGFRRAIAHGMWTKARALAGVLPSRPLIAAQVAVSFKTPAFLPSAATLQVDNQEHGRLFAVRSARDARPHLCGRLQGVSTI